MGGFMEKKKYLKKIRNLKINNIDDNYIIHNKLFH